MPADRLDRANWHYGSPRCKPWTMRSGRRAVWAQDRRGRYCRRFFPVYELLFTLRSYFFPIAIPDRSAGEDDIALIHFSAGGGIFFTFSGPNSRFFSSKYGLRPARTGYQCGVHTTAQAETDDTDRQQQHRRQRRRRHGGGGIAIGCCRCGGGGAALVLAVCLLRLPAAPEALLLRAALGLWLWLRLRATAAAAPHARRRPRRGSSPSSLASWDSARPGLEPGPSLETERKF
jgi:hypothetical protein